MKFNNPTALINHGFCNPVIRREVTSLAAIVAHVTFDEMESMADKFIQADENDKITRERDFNYYHFLILWGELIARNKVVVKHSFNRDGYYVFFWSKEDALVFKMMEDWYIEVIRKSGRYWGRDRR